MPLTQVQPGMLGTPQPINFKNRIINGAMVIDQRNAGASVTATTSAPYSVDRFFIYSSPTSKFTGQQNAGSVTPPVGFVNYLGCTSSSAYTVSGIDIMAICQRIEGNNLADLAWGTANAKTVTLSFQVYSSLTGTFGGAIQNANSDRSYPFTYTISSANTWTSISVTIAGDTTGTWSATTGTGMQLWIGLGVGATRSGTANAWAGANYVAPTGAVSVVGTSGATFYITGVQLEQGVTATNFDVRSYGTELMLCQRYCQMFNSNEWNDLYRRYATVVLNNTTSYNGILNLLVKMRSTPALTTSGSFSLWNGSFLSSVSAPTIASTGADVVDITGTNGTGTLGGIYHLLSSANNTSYMLFTAEL